MDFTFLYCDYKIEPPKKVPLWYDYELTYKSNDILLKYITKEKPNVIIIPLSYSSVNPNQELIIELKKIGYNKIYETSSMGIIKNVIIIYIYFYLKK